MGALSKRETTNTSTTLKSKKASHKITLTNFLEWFLKGSLWTLEKYFPIVMLPFALVVLSMYLIITHSLPTSVEKYPGFKNECVTFSTTAQNVVLLSLI